MRAIFALVLAVLCAQQTLGFKIQSFKVEAGEDIDKDIMELLTQHIKNMDPRVMDRQDIDKANEDIDKDSEDIDKDSEDIDKDSEDIDNDSEDIDKDSEDIDKDSEDIDKDNDEKGLGCRGKGLACNNTNHRCCGALRCIRYKGTKGHCVYRESLAAKFGQEV